jgi:hypothetical protein
LSKGAKSGGTATKPAGDTGSAGKEGGTEEADTKGAAVDSCDVDLVVDDRVADKSLTGARTARMADAAFPAGIGVCADVRDSTAGSSALAGTAGRLGVGSMIGTAARSGISGAAAATGSLRVSCSATPTASGRSRSRDPGCAKTSAGASDGRTSRACIDGRTERASATGRSTGASFRIRGGAT